MTDIKAYDGLSAAQQLNLFRNLHYNDGNATENGIIANAINDILPVVRKPVGKEVIRALECCANGECDECPYQDDSPCKEYLNNAALDLINRQRAEIERLTIEYAGFRGAANSLKMHYNNARAEAIKEFAEVVKDNRNRLFNTIYSNYHFGGLIDELVKEMTEGKPCTDSADCSTCENCYHDGGYNECATDGVKL